MTPSGDPNIKGTRKFPSPSITESITVKKVITDRHVIIVLDT